MGTRIVHADSPVDRSPSGLAIRHLVSGTIGSRELYAGEQWLEPGERVLLHTHPVEEVLIFTGGDGEVTLGDETVPVSGGAKDLMAALRSLDADGVEVLDVGLRRPTLDDVFLSLTGHSTEEPAAGSDPSDNGRAAGSQGSLAGASTQGGAS